MRERGALALAHGLDDARAAVDRVAAGEDAPVRRAAVVVDDDLPPVDLEAVEAPGQLGARPLADRLDDGVGAQDELGAGNGLRAAAAARVRRAEPHRDAFDGLDVAARRGSAPAT